MNLAVQMAVALALVAQGDPKEAARGTIQKTRAQKCYSTSFKTRLTPPAGDSMEYEGKALWVSPGVLYVHYTGSGGRDRKVIRAGSKVEYACHVFKDKPGKCPKCERDLKRVETPNIWIHSKFGWQTADEFGDTDAARGIQNPDEVLKALLDHLDSATFVDKSSIKLTFTGEDIAKVMQEQGRQDGVDWKRSKAEILMNVDGEGRLGKITLSASTVSTDPAARGTGKFDATVEVVKYGAETRMRFVDAETKREIKLSDEIQKAIEQALKPR